MSEWAFLWRCVPRTTKIPKVSVLIIMAAYAEKVEEKEKDAAVTILFRFYYDPLHCINRREGNFRFLSLWHAKVLWLAVRIGWVGFYKKPKCKTSFSPPLEFRREIHLKVLIFREKYVNDVLIMCFLFCIIFILCSSGWGNPEAIFGNSRSWWLDRRVKFH